MSGTKKGTITDNIRQFAAAQSLIRKKQIKETFDYTSDQITSAVVTLVKQGYLKKIAHGTYEFTDKKAMPPQVVNDRIWHAMRINVKWTASDIALQAGTTQSYIYKRMRLYRAKDFIKPAGQRKNTGSSCEKLWMVTQKGRQQIKRPAVEEFKPDPIVTMAVKLNRLICTGLIKYDAAAKKEALKIAGEIAGELDK